MSTERLNRIIEEVKSLSPDDRRRLLDRLEKDEELWTPKMSVRRASTLKGTVKYMAPDFGAPLDDFTEYGMRLVIDSHRAHLACRSTSTT
jgi:hypothetical protein